MLDFSENGLFAAIAFQTFRSRQPDFPMLQIDLKGLTGKQHWQAPFALAIIEAPTRLTIHAIIYIEGGMYYGDDFDY